MTKKEKVWDYVLYVEQSGEGCDYTIGCARQVYPLDALTKAEAVAEATKMLTESWDDNDDSLRSVVVDGLEKACILRFEVALDVNEIDAIVAAATEAEDKAHEKAKDLEQLEKLKKKYEGK